MVTAAIERRIDCICIADHNETKGALEALRFASGKPILVIPGIEVKAKEGDILALNIKEKIAKGLGAEETIKEINKLGGMAIIVHPFAWPKHFKGNIRDLEEKNPDLLIGIEVLNAAIPDYANKKALDLAKSFGLLFCAGSDAHETDSIGKAFLEIEKDCHSAQELLEEIRKGRVVAKGGDISIFEKYMGVAKRTIRKLKRGKLRV